MTAEPLPLPSPLSRAQPWTDAPRRLVLLVAAVALALIAGFVGHLIGSAEQGVHVAQGNAYASEYQISVTTGGWSYNIPLDVRWRASDAQGGWHEGSRPACLPASRQLQPVKFGWVPVNAPDHVGWRSVVWVDCR